MKSGGADESFIVHENDIDAMSFSWTFERPSVFNLVEKFFSSKICVIFDVVDGSRGTHVEEYLSCKTSIFSE